MKKILIMLLLVSATSCSNQTRSTAIEKEKFETLYVELLDSASAHQPATTDSTVSPTAERILRRNGVTPEQFKATVRYYNTNATKWKEFYENVAKRISTRDTVKISKPKSM